MKTSIFFYQLKTLFFKKLERDFIISRVADIGFLAIAR